MNIWKFLDLRILWYYILQLFNSFFASNFLFILGILTLYMLSGLFVIVLIILFVPRLIEDYVKLYNWYINSDFFQIFEEKASIRLIIKIIFSPILLFIALLFSIVNIIVRTGYQIVLKLQLLYCINCSSYISFNEEEMICPYCGEIHKGTPDTSCPKCNFKANSIYCPYCGFLVFIDLTGKKSLEQRKK